MKRRPLNYCQLWSGLIATIVREIIKIDKQGDGRSVEDMWVQGTLCQIIKRMCAAEHLHPGLQNEPMPMRQLFDDGMEEKPL